MGDLWSFYKSEKYHGKKARAYQITVNGQNREILFCNDPENQRVAKCQKCGIKIPREVPRLKFVASFYYGSGYYCLSCGLKLLQDSKEALLEVVSDLKDTTKEYDELTKISLEVMTNPFYKKKMALGKMLQVMTEKDEEDI